MGAPYQRLAARLRARIEAGEWPPGCRLPSHAQLQTQYGVGRGVVEGAIAKLRTDGLLEGVRRARPTVAYPPAVRTLTNPDADWPASRDARRREGRPSAIEDLALRLGVPVGSRLAMEAVELVDAQGVTVGGHAQLGAMVGVDRTRPFGARCRCTESPCRRQSSRA
ncbi:hypothetical protein GCM10020000_06070 [Streptomyces olivoverticillatus]